jgi:hypothetical protein
MGCAIYNGMGGVSVENIRGLLDAFGVPVLDQGLMMERILIFASECSKESQGSGA